MRPPSGQHRGGAAIASAPRLANPAPAIPRGNRGKRWPALDVVSASRRRSHPRPTCTLGEGAHLAQCQRGWRLLRLRLAMTGASGQPGPGPRRLTPRHPARMSRRARRPDGRCPPGSPGGQRKVRAPREYGAGQLPAGATPGKVPQKTDRPRARVSCPQGFVPRCPAGKGEKVRQERTAPLATGVAGQTPPGARPNRGGRRHGTKTHFVPWPRRRSRLVARVGRERRAARRVPEEWPSRAGRATCRYGQNPAYRPSGTVFPQGVDWFCRRYAPRCSQEQKVNAQPKGSPHPVSRVIARKSLSFESKFAREDQ